MEVAIRVEGLRKEYVLFHESRLARQRSIRDLAENIKNRIINWNKLPNQSDHRFVALDDITFHVSKGDVLGIIGNNGAGKSTLLKILCRITSPTLGKIFIHGRIASLLEVGTGFHPELTGRDNIFLNGAILGMKKQEIKKKFDDIVAFSEIEKFIDSPVKYYSSGMYMRLAFSVAAFLESEVLIVDEVLAVGDIRFQNKCMGLMEDMGKQGRTILFVSHNMAAVQLLCNRCILLDSGHMIYDGKPSDVIEAYCSNLTKQTCRQIKTRGARFIDAFISDVHFAPIFMIQFNSTAYLVIDVFIENEHTSIGFTIYKNGMALLSSYALDNLNNIPKGFSRFRIDLPSDFFTSGTYTVEGAIWDAYSLYDQSDCLATFTFHRNSILESRGMEYRGMLASPSKWDIVYNHN